MAKKRGGRRIKAKKAEQILCDKAVNQQNGLAATEEAVADGTEEKGKGRRSSNSRLSQNRNVSEYFGRIKQLIEDCPFQGHVQFEAFVTSTIEEIIKRVRGSSLRSKRRLEALTASYFCLLSYSWGLASISVTGFLVYVVCSMHDHRRLCVLILLLLFRASWLYPTRNAAAWWRN